MFRAARCYCLARAEDQGSYFKQGKDPKSSRIRSMHIHGQKPTHSNSAFIAPSPTLPTTPSCPTSTSGLAHERWFRTAHEVETVTPTMMRGEHRWMGPQGGHAQLLKGMH